MEIDPESRKFYVAMRKEVVEEVEDPATQITIEDAVKHALPAGSFFTARAMAVLIFSTKYSMGIPFSWPTAQSAKHVIRQGIREAEKGLLFQEFRSRQGDCQLAAAAGLPADGPDLHHAVVDLGHLHLEEALYQVGVGAGDHQAGALLPVLGIHHVNPDLLAVHKLLPGHLLALQIRAISREAGSRSKLAVTSRDENVDPVGACIGPKGIRVTSIVEELGGGKGGVLFRTGKPPYYFYASSSGSSGASPASSSARRGVPSTGGGNRP